MPSHHRFVLNQDSDFFLREAAKIGPQTAAFMTAVLRSRPFPQQAFRTCLGILDLARKYLPAHLETACQRLLTCQAPDLQRSEVRVGAPHPGSPGPTLPRT